MVDAGSIARPQFQSSWVLRSGGGMDGKARMILVSTMTAIMVLVVTFVATLINIGLRADFVSKWIAAYLTSWPIAAITGFLVMPSARRFTTWVLNRTGAAP
jgi:hypothetical protein